VARARELRRGDGGEDVKALQRELAKKGFPSGKADGDFGENTERAVREFQRSAGLKGDGVVGLKTWTALGIDPAPPSNSVTGAFVERAGPIARENAREFGVPASVTLAQAILESDSGRAHMGEANNYFGIKAFTRNGRIDFGPIAKGFVTLQTKERVNGRTIVVNAHFRKYASMTDSFRDHSNFLRVNSRYKPAFAHTKQPDEFARAIHRAGYATDEVYSDKLIGLMRQYDLYRFDKPAREGGGKRPPKPHKERPKERPKEPPRDEGRLDKDERQEAYVAALQSSLNACLRHLGAVRMLPIDGRWDDRTERAFKDVCRVLGIEPERDMRTYRLIAGAAAARNQEELARAESDGAAYAKELRERFAQERAVVDPQVPLGGTPLSAEERRRARVAALQGDINGLMKRLGVGTRLAVDGKWDAHTQRAFEDACRVLGVEPERTVRTFRLIAGAADARTKEELARARRDGAAYAKKLRHRSPAAAQIVLGGRSLPREERQRATVAVLQRDLNEHLVRLGSPAVLAVDGKWGKHTARAFEQICRVLGVEPERNVRTFRIVGAGLAPRTPAEEKRALEDGAEFERELHETFLRQRANPPSRPPDRPPDRPPPADSDDRLFRVTDPNIKGREVRALQRALNGHLKRWKVPKRLKADGRYGPVSHETACEVAFGLGVARSQFEDGFGLELRLLIADPTRRTAAQRKRAEQRAEYRKRLRGRYRTPDVSSLLGGNAAPRVPALLEIIVDAHRHGLVVTSTTGGKHAAGSYHYQGRAVDFGVPGNPHTPDAQQRFKTFQRKLARHPEHFAELIGPDVHANVKNGRFMRYDASTEGAHTNHCHVAI
jgi:peptidoglycan hydrolase-like protein with peptidoglycan-binding domain